MKYLFTGIGKLLYTGTRLIMYAFIQLFLIIWHLDGKRLFPYKDFNYNLYPLLSWVVIFLTCAMVAAIFGWGSLLTGNAEALARILFFIFLILFILSCLAGMHNPSKDMNYD